MIAALAGAAAVALYLAGVAAYRRRLRARRFPPWRVGAFIAGVALMAYAGGPRFEAAAGAAFEAHMLQHLVMMFLAPPLLLLGAPLLLLVAATPPAAARRMTAFAGSAFGRAVFAPLTGWLTFVGVLWGVHFSPLFEFALEHPWAHAAEHALFVGSALLFWGAVVQVGYAPREVPYPARMLYVFLAIPQGAFVAFALGASNRVLYPYYLQAFPSPGAALADQRGGADLMWIVGGFLLFAAFMLVAAAWAHDERRAAA